MTKLSLPPQIEPTPDLDEMVSRARVAAGQFNPTAGVYFLFRGDELLYVGETVNVLGIIYTHVTGSRAPRRGTTNKQIPLDRVAWVPVQNIADRKRIEAALIERFSPRFNAPHEWRRRPRAPKIVAELPQRT
jgi:excinuclease UvrABC nuclease subunit